MGTDQIVQLLVTLLSTAMIAAIAYFIKSITSDIKQTLAQLTDKLNEFGMWKQSHTTANKQAFRTLDQELHKCKRGITKLRKRVQEIEHLLEDGDEDD